jgi:hypothetical protein
MIDRMSVTSSLLYLLADGAGAFDLMMYTETMDEVQSTISEGWDAAERMCGEAWTSHFDQPAATHPAATPAAGRVRIAAW